MNPLPIPDEKVLAFRSGSAYNSVAGAKKVGAFFVPNFTIEVSARMQSCSYSSILFTFAFCGTRFHFHSSAVLLQPGSTSFFWRGILHG